MTTLTPFRSFLDPLRALSSMRRGAFDLESDDFWSARDLLQPVSEWQRNMMGGLDLWSPDLDVIDKPDRYVVRAEVPGLDTEHVTVTAEGRELCIRGEREKEELLDGESFRLCERQYGSFTRILSLPTPFDHKSIEAEIRNGVLTIELEKLEASKPAKVNVKARD